VGRFLRLETEQQAAGECGDVTTAM
jgi:hypothetical protein